LLVLSGMMTERFLSPQVKEIQHGWF